MAKEFDFSNAHITNLNITIEAAERRPVTEARFDSERPDPTARFHPVRPGPGLTGTICALIKVAPPLGRVVADVQALVYDYNVFIDPTGSQPPPAAVSGHAELADFWSWGGASSAAEIPFAVHNAAGSALNALAVWKRYQGDVLFEYDGRLLFAGKTGVDGPCGEPGSGSGGSGGSGGWGGAVAAGLAALAGAKTLDITVPDGKQQGVYKAVKSGHNLWAATIAGVKFSVSVGGCGKRLVLSNPAGSLVSAEVVGRPLTAAFHGDDGAGVRQYFVTES